MNLSVSNQQHQFQGKKGTLSVMGNGNQIKLTLCQVNINLVGNGNTLFLHGCQGVLQINGNNNVFGVRQSKLSISVNGNKNKLSSSESNISVLNCNGAGNSIQENTSSTRNSANWNTKIFGEQVNTSHCQCPISQENYSNIFGVDPEDQGEGHQALQRRNSMNKSNQRRSLNPNELQRNYSLVEQYIPNYTSMIDQEEPRRIQPALYQQPAGQGLSQNEIDLLPTSNYSGKPDKCTICWDEIVSGAEVTHLLCSHCFHRDCSTDWLRKSANCPLCHANMREQILAHQE